MPADDDVSKNANGPARQKTGPDTTQPTHGIGLITSWVAMLYEPTPFAVDETIGMCDQDRDTSG